MKYLFFISALLLTVNAFSQKKVLYDKAEDVKKMAAKDFEKAMSVPDGELYLFATENEITGKYTFKISIGLKNKVTSVFVQEREGGNISMQNKVKDAVKAFEFSFKVPKGKHYNMIYTFNFK